MIGAPATHFVRSLLLDRRGDLWVGTNAGLNCLRKGDQRLEQIASDPGDPQSLAGQYIFSLFEASDGRIWIGAQANGVAVQDPADGTLRRLAIDPAGRQGVAHPWIVSIAEPRLGEIWVTTFGGGIQVFDISGAHVLRSLRHDPAVPGSLVLDRSTQLLVDRSGLIWVGTWGAGLQRHNPTNLQHAADDASGQSPADCTGKPAGLDPGTIQLASQLDSP